MTRVKFKKGEQRKFLLKVLEETHCPSLRALNQFGFDVPYSTLKNYFTEKRFLPKELFVDLCELSKINPSLLDTKFVSDNWGQVEGGKKSKR